MQPSSLLTVSAMSPHHSLEGSVCSSDHAGAVTTRDGYVVHPSEAISRLVHPQFWISGSLSIGWVAWAQTAAFWCIALAIKVAFDYFIIWKVWTSVDEALAFLL